MIVPSESYTTRPSRRLVIAAVVTSLTVGVLLFVAFAFVGYQIVDREAIHDAARRGDVEEVRRILDKNPKRLEQRNRLELTPLHIAAMDGQPEVLEELVRRGADVHAKWDLAASGDGQWNALHITAIHGRVSAAEVLIRAGAHINARTLKGQTPRDVAVRNRHFDLAAVLGANGGVLGSDR